MGLPRHDRAGPAGNVGGLAAEGYPQTPPYEWWCWHDAYGEQEPSRWFGDPDPDDPNDQRPPRQQPESVVTVPRSDPRHLPTLSGTTGTHHRVDDGTGLRGMGTPGSGVPRLVGARRGVAHGGRRRGLGQRAVDRTADRRGDRRPRPRFGGHDGTELLGAWPDAAARLDQLAETSGLEPPLGDIACHEHDIRGAIGRPGARDAQSVLWTSDRLLTNLRPPVPLRVIVEDGEYRSGPPDGTEIQLRTTRFEALRWRTGRRSRAQLAAMDWSSDPTPILDHLYLFGPAASDVIE